MDPTTTFKFEDQAHKLEATVKALAAEVASLRAGRVPDNPENERLMQARKTNAKLRYQLEKLREAVSGPKPADSVTIPNFPDKSVNLIAAVTEVFTSAILRAFPGTSVQPNIKATQSKNRKKGMYQCDAALPLAGALKKQGNSVPPRQIAEALVAALPENNIVASCVLSGPGFINITLEAAFVSAHVAKISTTGVLPPAVKRRRCCVDLSSPNIAKVMHVGHLRSTIIGDAIARVLEYVGHDVLRINHVGDWGTQFGMLIAHLKDEFPNFETVSPPIEDLQKFYQAAKKRFDDPEFKKRAYEETAALQGGRSPAVTKAWTLICDVSRREFAQIYKRLDVRLEEKGESFYQSMMDSVCADLKATGQLIDDPSAPGRKIIWTKAKDRVGIPLIMTKSDGAYTYDTSDMATIRYRLQHERGEWLIYVVDSGQSGHFENVFACAEEAGWWNPDEVRVDHVGFGVVLGEDGKRFRTRSGDTVPLKDLLDEGVKRCREFFLKREAGGHKSDLSDADKEASFEAVAYGCIKYSDLCNNRLLDYKFDYAKMLSDKGNTAVYLLYAYARLRSILTSSDVKDFGIDFEAARTTHNLELSHPLEIQLATQLLTFPETIEKVLSDLQPRHICSFLYETCELFTAFYGSCYCIKKDRETKKVISVDINRLMLVDATAKVISQGLALLGIRTLERM